MVMMIWWLYDDDIIMIYDKKTMIWLYDKKTIWLYDNNLMIWLWYENDDDDDTHKGKRMWGCRGEMW